MIKNFNLNKAFIYRKRVQEALDEAIISFNVLSPYCQEDDFEKYSQEYQKLSNRVECLSFAKYILNAAIQRANNCFDDCPQKLVSEIEHRKQILSILKCKISQMKDFQETEKVYDETYLNENVNPPIKGRYVKVKNKKIVENLEEKFREETLILRDLEEKLAEKNSYMEVELPSDVVIDGYCVEDYLEKFI